MSITEGCTLEETDLLSGGHELENAFALHRERLKRLVSLRLDPKLRSRVDDSDVIQDAYVEAATRWESYLRDRPMSLFLWIRFLVSQQIVNLERHHLGTAKRDAGREISLHRPAFPGASSALLAEHLIGDLTPPSQAAAREETRSSLEQALNGMDEIDREVIALRHFEELSRRETAEILGIEESAVSKRFVRALKRLKDKLAGVPECEEG